MVPVCTAAGRDAATSGLTVIPSDKPRPQVRYLNNIMEQDHRAVKRVVRPMLGFKPHETAQLTIAGIELMHILKKQQLVTAEGERYPTLAQQFYALVG
jgi:putative transposase